MYVPAAQSNQRVRYLMVRAAGTPEMLARAVRSAAHEVDPGFTVGEAVAMNDVVAQESAPWRFIYRVFVMLGTLALTLAIVGLGAVINLALATRHRELGIRAALGAGRRHLTGVILTEALTLVIVGSILGAGAALALGRTIGGVLIGVPPYDPVSLGTAIAVTITSGAACCWWSARRAADVMPDVVLRSE
jgi:ABC-type antimicrobial peptide transport system permease subunit